MKQKISFSILLAFLMFKITSAQESTQKPIAAEKKFTIENCINRFDKDQVIKTPVGYQYWFIGQKVLDDGQTLKMSVLGPKQSSHAPHKHAGNEMFFVLEGTAQFYLDGKTATGGANTSFMCPDNSEHGISNAGNTELKYLVIRKY